MKYQKKFSKQAFEQLKTFVHSLSDVVDSLVNPEGVKRFFFHSKLKHLFKISADPEVAEHCDKIKRLRDENGNFLTKICVQAKPATSADARDACKGVGLKLLKVSTEKLEKSLNAILKDETAKPFWVAGAGDSKCVSVRVGPSSVKLVNDSDCAAKYSSFCEIVKTTK